MLYQLFALNRDDSLRRLTYGQSTSIGYDLGTSLVDLCGRNIHPSRLNYDGTMLLGLTLTFDGNPRALTFHKSIEVWTESDASNNSIHHNSKHAVILERFLYQTENGLLPYAWKYTNRFLHTTTLVHAPNLQNVHGKLQGLSDVLFINDPKKIYLDILAEHRGNIPEERFLELQFILDRNKVGCGFVNHVFNKTMIEHTLTIMRDQLSWNFSHEHNRTSPKQVYKEFIVPQYHVNDPISLQYPEGSIAPGQLLKYYIAPPFDVSPPDALVITRPDLLKIDGEFCQIASDLLSKVKLTDYSIVVNLSQGAVIGHHWEYATNRYLALFDSANNRELTSDQIILYKIARLVFEHVVYDISQTELLFNVAQHTCMVNITKTFAEEALISLSTQGEIRACWHIDFAMQAFCSIGLSSDFPVPQTPNFVREYDF